jgi:putative DNA primase/helicase
VKSCPMRNGQQRGQSLSNTSNINSILRDANTAESMRAHSDVDRAEGFCRRHQDDLRYVADRGTWLRAADNGIWHEKLGGDLAATSLAIEYAKDIANLIIEQAPDGDPQAVKDASRRAASIKGRTCIANVVGLAKSVSGMTVSSKDLDADPNLIGTKSGVLDLCAGRIVTGPISSYVTREMPVSWDPDAECPVFERFLKQMAREDMSLVAMLVQWFGYLLSGDVSEQKFMILFGERGRNGKSVLFNVIKDIMGTYAFPIEKGLLTVTNQPNRFSLSTLEGVRAALASETSKQTRLNVEFVKAFTAGDPMYAERKGTQGYQFIPQAKLMFALNTLPLADFDPSFRSRVIPVPLMQSFYRVGEREYRPGDLEPDLNLRQQLLSELPGILNLMVRGFADWRENGLLIPESVRILTDQFEEQNDHVGAWLLERCRIAPGLSTRTTDLFTDFREYCSDLRIPQPGRLNEFVARLGQEIALENKNHSGVSMWKGIGLKSNAFSEVA